MAGRSKAKKGNAKPTKRRARNALRHTHGTMFRLRSGQAEKEHPQLSALSDGERAESGDPQ